MVKFKLKDIKPNPFRNIDNYPIRKEKVAALRESIGQTGFWDNVVARQNNGSVEIAYGHHRLEALRQEFGPNHQIEMIVRPLNDEHMIKIMARENMEEWGSNAQIEMETIKAVVQAFAEGKIKLPPIKTSGKGGGNFRCAPSFEKQADRFREDENRYYNAQTVAEFIGWLAPNGEAQVKVHTALNALELIEKGILSEKEFKSLSSTEAQALVSETSSTFKWRAQSIVHAHTAIPKAQAVGAAVSAHFQKEKKEDKRGWGAARERASKVRDKIDARPKRIPEVHEFIEKINGELFGILRPGVELTNKILEILKVIDDVEKDDRGELHGSLIGLANRAIALAKMVKKGSKAIPTAKEFTRLLLHASDEGRLT
jgi:hypothetical protein